MLGLAFVLAAGTFFENPAQAELNAYIRKPDASYSWRVCKPVFGHSVLALTSQTWHGGAWRHSIVLSSPARFVARDTAVIYITGDDPDAADERDADSMSRESGLPVATLYNIPVQPIGGLQEDELIASTFEKFLQAGDASDLLLWPMAKSVIRTMDVLRSWSHGRLKKFVLWGESKRAWTAWMAAATGDKRIIGLAPCSFDNLNIPAQMKLQLKEWGHYSPAISAYTNRGLPETLSTARGKKLAELVDPYTYLSRLDEEEVPIKGSIKTRILTVRGTNDPYWVLDAYEEYRLAMPEDATLLVLPNEGHDFKDKRLYLRTVGTFAACCATGTKWPIFRMRRFRDLGLYSDSSQRAVSTRLWVANSPDPESKAYRWFIQQRSSKQTFDAGNSLKYLHDFAFPPATLGYQGVVGEADFTVIVRGVKHRVSLSSIPIRFKGH